MSCSSSTRPGPWSRRTTPPTKCRRRGCPGAAGPTVSSPAPNRIRTAASAAPPSGMRERPRSGPCRTGRTAPRGTRRRGRRATHGQPLADQVDRARWPSLPVVLSRRTTPTAIHSDRPRERPEPAVPRGRRRRPARHEAGDADEDHEQRPGLAPVESSSAWRTRKTRPRPISQVAAMSEPRWTRHAPPPRPGPPDRAVIGPRPDREDEDEDAERRRGRAARTSPSRWSGGTRGRGTRRRRG